MILCAGEALIDMLPRRTEAGEDTYLPDPGGAVHNTAVALGRLGVDTGFFSGMSSDPFGQLLRDKLDECGVDHSMSVTADRPTTLAFVKLTDGHATYFFYDENTAGRMLTPADLPDVSADALFFGGISLVVEPCGGAYEALMLREAPSKVTMIDPNIRPSFITDEPRYRARLAGMMGVADIVKTSDEDLDWILGSTDPAPLFDGTDVQVVLLTRGADGVSVITRSGQFDVPARQATVVDTVGAGDTFNAGFLAGLSRAGRLSKAALASSNDALHAAATLGAQAAAITVSRAGANPPWSSEI